MSEDEKLPFDSTIDIATARLRHRGELVGPFRARLNNPMNVIPRLGPSAGNFPTLFSAPGHCDSTYHFTYYTQHLDCTLEMTSSPIARPVLRAFSHARPLRSSAPRVATRCMHQQTSPIATLRLQHRPTAQTWKQRTVAPSTIMSRRTMFIQTEPTPNPDVGMPHPMLTPFCC